MAYVPTTFVDRSVEFPNRRKLTAVSGQTDTFDVERAEGTVFAEGTKPDAANLNAEFGNVKTELDTIINDYINGIDVRYNASLSQAEWSIRGADAWNPFSKMPQQMYTVAPGSSFVPSVKWINNEFTISLYSSYYVAFDVRNFTKMKIKAFSRYADYTSALFSDTTLNTTQSMSNTLVRTFHEPITSEIEIDISNYDFITLCAYGSDTPKRYSGYGGLFTGVSFE